VSSRRRVLLSEQYPKTKRQAGGQAIEWINSVRDAGAKKKEQASRLGEAGGETAPNDRELVRRTLAGDRDAFAHLHRRYYPRVYRLALFRCRNAQDAEDAASETFVRAITHLGTFRFGAGESVFPWLGRICTNYIADQARRGGGATLVSLDAGSVDGVRALLDGLASDKPSPHELAERTETQALMRSAVAGLPRDQQEAILLRFGADMPLKEIAAEMNKSEGAIKSLLHRATANLRKALLSGATEAEVFAQYRNNVAATATPAAEQTNQSYHGSLDF